MSQPSDPTLPAPDADSTPSWAEPGDSPEHNGGYGPGSGYGGPPGGYGPGSGYGGPPGGYGPPLIDGPDPLLVSFAPAAKQNRLTVAFRLLLAVPHLIILYALTIAAEVVAFIGWFAALFTGSLPEWAHTFITGVLRWQARVYAYNFFLTGVYPPFSLEDEPYPVRLVTARARLNRLAVFFRFILLIPAGIVLLIALYGMFVLSVFLWLIALVAGRLPGSLHQAVAAVLRFLFRFYGYEFLVTGAYPWHGLYGDAVAVPVAAPGLTADADSTQADATDPWRLQLSGAGKALVTLVLVLGVAVVPVLGVVLGSAATNSSSPLARARSLVIVDAAYKTLGTSSAKFESAVQACSQLSCVTAQDRQEVTAIQAFASSVSSAGITGPATADVTRLVNDANGAADSLGKLAASTSVAQYQSDVSGSPLQQQLTSLDADYTKLVNDLRG